MPVYTPAEGKGEICHASQTGKRRRTFPAALYHLYSLLLTDEQRLNGPLSWEAGTAPGSAEDSGCVPLCSYSRVSLEGPFGKQTKAREDIPGSAMVTDPRSVPRFSSVH